MTARFLLRSVRFVLVLVILSMVIVSSSEAGAQYRFKLVIGDEGTEGSAYVPTVRPKLIDEGLRPKTPEEVKDEGRCQETATACNAYAEKMVGFCRNLQSGDWTDDEDCEASRSRHISSCLVEYKCKK